MKKEPTPPLAAVVQPRLVRIGIADFKCNSCGKIVQLDLGWKTWHPSYCESTGKKARLYRISAPSLPNSKDRSPKG